MSNHAFCSPLAASLYTSNVLFISFCKEKQCFGISIRCFEQSFTIRIFANARKNGAYSFWYLLLSFFTILGCFITSLFGSYAFDHDLVHVVVEWYRVSSLLGQLIPSISTGVSWRLKKDDCEEDRVTAVSGLGWYNRCWSLSFAMVCDQEKKKSGSRNINNVGIKRILLTHWRQWWLDNAVPTDTRSLTLFRYRKAAYP